MKVASAALFTILLAVATVGAARIDTNAYRMARGLPPNAPVKRGTPVLAAKRGGPSASVCTPELQLCTADAECCSGLFCLGVCI
ncbi:hypothetical protein C8R45DRAFT_1004083 [Mycena sanguinolenta]|nr:hypothetical protein C8R45DRAFT_1004083 [Mycena sanguinolenta]